MMFEKGFTLLEVMVSLTVLSLVMGAVGPSFFVRSKVNTNAETKTSAIQAAQLKLDQLRLLDPMDFPTTGSDAAEELTLGSKTFSLVTSYCEDASFCSSTRTRHLTVRVAYQGESIYEIETVFTKLR